MGPLQLIINVALTMVVYGLALFAIYRIVQISNDVSEIKELVRRIERSIEDAPAPAPPPRVEAQPSQSAEAMVRAVHENWQVGE